MSQLSTLQTVTRAARPRARRDSLGILGGGNAAHSLAAYLSALGHGIHMLLRTPQRAEAIRSRGSLVATGKLNGVYPIADATVDPAAVARECRTLFLATTTDAYAEVAARIAPYLSSEHELILFSGKLGGCLEVDRVLQNAGCSGVRVIETDALFASRLQEDGSIWIRGIKKWNLYTCSQHRETRRNGAILERFFSGLEPADNAIQRGVTDFGAMAHPLTMLCNMNRVDRQEPFLFYCDGFTERTVRLLEQVEAEFRSVARAYGTDLLPAPELLNRYYGCRTDSLLEAMRSVPNYRTSYAPARLDHRYLREDVACTLVPLQQLGRVASVPTPLVDSVISLASALTGESFQTTGRTLARLGLDGMSRAEILDRLN